MFRNLVLLMTLLVPPVLQAETGYDTWLRYAKLDEAAARQYRNSLPATITILGDSQLQRSAEQELVRGIRGMLGRTLRFERAIPNEPAVVLGTLDQIQRS